MQQAFQYFDFGMGAFVLQAQQYNAMMRLSFAVHLLAKILVVRDQYPVFVKCFLYNIIIVHSPRQRVH
jgi:hypothetical protein